MEKHEFLGNVQSCILQFWNEFLKPCIASGVPWSVKLVLQTETQKCFLRASMVATYYIKLFRTEADRHNGILMSLLLLVAETISKIKNL